MREKKLLSLLLAIVLTVTTAAVPLAASTAPADYPNNTPETVDPDTRNPNAVTVAEGGGSVTFEVVDTTPISGSSPITNPNGTTPHEMELRVAPNGSTVRLLDVTWDAADGTGAWEASNATDGAYICDSTDGISSTYDWCDVEDGTTHTYSLSDVPYGVAIDEDSYPTVGDYGYEIRHLSGWGDWQGEITVEYLYNGERESVTLDVDGDWDDDGYGNWADDYPFTRPRIVDTVPISPNDNVSSVTLRTQTVANVSAVYGDQGGRELNDSTYARHLDPSDEYGVVLLDEMPSSTSWLQAAWYDGALVGSQGLFGGANYNMLYNESLAMPRSDWVIDNDAVINTDSMRYVVVYGHGDGIYDSVDIDYSTGGTREEYVLPVNRSRGTPETVDVALATGESEVEVQVRNASSGAWTILDTQMYANESAHTASYNISEEYREVPHDTFRVIVRGDGAQDASLTYMRAGGGAGAGPGLGVPLWLLLLVAVVIVAGTAYHFSTDDDELDGSPRC
ncbi:hypothetical protein [Halobaculum limi]|uniref:hypothetical protein n=1 Tax=Halobaculum limi TaxID=3031916 RepID=UPI0024057B89|nr:hypothetical protein [Halobaculum sp. YSMS11]